MSKKRYVDTKFWDDNYIIEKDPSEKLLFLYLLTNTLTNIVGIYEISIKRIAFDTGLDKDMVINMLKKFETDDKIKYENGWLAFKNFIKHQLDNPKINAAMKELLKEVPDDLIKWANIDHDRLSISVENVDNSPKIVDNSSNDSLSHSKNDRLSHLNTNTNLNTNTHSNSKNDALSNLKKEMLNAGCFENNFINNLFKKYPASEIEKYYEELKYLENINNPSGWLMYRLKKKEG